MKSYVANLQALTQTSYANNGKTTLLGRILSNTYNSQPVFGPRLNQWMDIFQTFSLYPLDVYYNPNTGHLFVLSSASTTLTATNIWVMLFNFSAATSWTPSYVGRVNVNFGASPAGAPVIKGFEVYESGGNITPVITVTHATAIEGGKYIAYNLTTASFTVGGTTIFAASTSSQDGAMYFLQDPAALGVNHVATTAWGSALPQFSSTPATAKIAWQANGTFALPKFYSWDLTTAPTVEGTILNGVSSNSAGYGGTAPTAYFTMGASLNGYSLTAGEQVVLMNGTGNAPTPFSVWNGNSLQTTTNVYFVRDLQLVSGNYYFNLALTSGATAATLPTQSNSSFTMMRAFGISSSMFSLKTGVLTAITGGTLVANTMNYCKPVSAPANTTLQGVDCIAFQSTTALYAFKISDLTSEATTWPSLNASGITNTGTGIDVTAITTTFGEYSGQGFTYDIDNFIFTTNGSIYLAKPYRVPGSALTAMWGSTNNSYYAGKNPTSVQMGVVAPVNLHTMNGWFFVASQTTGQAGVIIGDIGADANFGNMGIISPVLSTVPGSILKRISSYEQYFDITATVNFWIRTASTSSDPVFSSGTLPVGAPTTSGTTSNGWTCIKVVSDLSAIAIQQYVQFAVTFNILEYASSIPVQINDIVYTTLPPGEQSDYWAEDNDTTTQGTGSPSYASFYLQSTYATSVPTLYARAYDTSGNLIFSANTSTNPTAFQYSTNSGTSWNSLGTIPNTVGTLVRVLVNPTPSGRAYSSLRES